jgi:hypothetical protein
VTGSVNYLVVGWFVSRANIGFLIPITIINGAAFVALVIAMWIAWTNGHILHPFQSRPVTIAEDGVDDEEEIPNEWALAITYHPTTVRCIFGHYLFLTNFSVCALGVQGILYEICETHGRGRRKCC